jgi:mono/diheme cytochrome c family protein
MSDEIKTACRNAEPAATRSTVPMWMVVLLLMLLFIGGVYFDYQSGWFNAKIYAPYASAEELDAYQPKSGAAAAAALGKVIYDRNCGICHSPDGMGKPNIAPPLAGSEWVNAPGFHRLAAIPLKGLNGPISIKGEMMTFPNGMVAIGAGMSDGDIAAVLTYIRAAWGNTGGAVAADDVKAIRTSLTAQPTPMTIEQLMNLPE